MKGFLVRTLGPALAFTIAAPAVASACFCAPTPFRNLAAKADRVVIGRVLDSVIYPTGDRSPDRYSSWVARIKVSRVVRGTASVGDIVTVGGRFASDCERHPKEVVVGKEYALALPERDKTSTVSFYALTVCAEETVPIGSVGRKPGVTIKQVEQWAKR